MHLKHFTHGSLIQFVSQRDGSIMLEVKRLESGRLERTGVTPLDDLRVEMTGSALDVRGLLYDGIGPVVRLLGDGGQESTADCYLVTHLAGRKPTRGLIATDETFHRVMKQSKPQEDP